MKTGVSFYLGLGLAFICSYFVLLASSGSGDVANDGFLLQIKDPAGIPVHFKADMKSGTVRTVKGTVKASERLLSDSGVVQYKIPDGWVSDINAIEVLEYPEAPFLLKVTASSGTKVLGGGELNKGEIVEAFRYQQFRFELHDGWVNEHDVTILRGNVDGDAHHQKKENATGIPSRSTVTVTFTPLSSSDMGRLESEIDTSKNSTSEAVDEIRQELRNAGHHVIYSSDNSRSIVYRVSGEMIARLPAQSVTSKPSVASPFAPPLVDSQVNAKQIKGAFAAKIYGFGVSVLGRLSGIAALLPGLARELCVSVDEILTTTMDGV